MKVHVLLENIAFSPEFASDHGLSLYIETEKHNILFDAGPTGAFADNAARLGIDLGKVDVAFISHGHYDHADGMRWFLELNDHAPVYVNENAFGRYFSGDRYIGMDGELEKYKDRFIITGDHTKIDDELELFTFNEVEKTTPLNSAGLTKETDGVNVPDDFLHEQFLVITEGERRVLVSGCTHKGILNVMDWVKPDVQIGGFHFMKEELEDGKSEYLDGVCDALSSYDAEYYTCHCTGMDQYVYMKERLDSQIDYIASGQILVI